MGGTSRPRSAATAINAYYVFRYSYPSLAYLGYTAACATCTSATVGGLTNGSAYQFLVFASNSVGNGTYTWSNVATAGASPDLLSPTGVVATRGDQGASVTWTAPVTRLLFPVSYMVYAYRAADGVQLPNPTSVAATTGTTVSTTVSDLTNGVATYFRVSATSLIFLTSPLSASSNTVIPAGIPLAPTGASASSGDSQASVSWVAANNNGSTITRYTVTASPGGVVTSTDGLTTQAIVTGLTNGFSYTFTVTATNAIGDGPPSSPAGPVVPSGVPFPATNVQATAGDGQATVSWEPAGANGSTISSYRVSSEAPAVQVDGSTTSTVISGLSNGSTYAFQVVAINGAGESQLSVPSNAVTPGPPPPPPPSAPGSPGIGLATAGNGAATLSWTAPTDLNGATLTGYVLTATSSDGATVAMTLADPAATTGAVGGLTNGTSYTITVAATSDSGTSPSSANSNLVWPLANPLGGPRIDAFLALPPPLAGSELGFQPCIIESDGPPESPRRATCRVLYDGPYTIDSTSTEFIEYMTPGEASGGGNYTLTLQSGAQIYEGCALQENLWQCSNSSNRPGRDAWKQHWQDDAGATYFWNSYEDWAGDSLFDCLKAYVQKDAESGAACVHVITGDPDN